ncbi:MAG: helix-turn-helix domain-containing protein [Methanomassiliicoccaceae archaeon]|jgi:DNA-binding transcriptional ArsR family regulator|nr:helix-turn-helix domain-containing protein [Methanomassiliicoccaceae archaeon]
MFELNVVSNTPLGAMTDVNTVAETFLVQIGYIPKGYDPKTDAANVRESVPYRLFMEFFMGNMTKAWTVDELAALMRTTKPTIYRHINKLKGMDILESADTEFDGQIRKGYRIRYGDLRKAWSFTEANVNMAMENYKKTVAHFQTLVDEERKNRV